MRNPWILRFTQNDEQEIRMTRHYLFIRVVLSLPKDPSVSSALFTP